MKRITIYSPNYYTYGAMLIGGILKEKFKNKYDIKLIRNLDKNNINLFLKSDFILLSLYSTMHLMDENLKKVIELIKNKNNNNNKKIKIYVGGPVSAYPEIILNELNVDGVIL